ncbi:MAG: class I SAM-dependent methyltransferase [Gemmatimonadota bacterium]
MLLTSLVLNALLLIATMAAFLTMRKYRQRLYVCEGRELAPAIPLVSLGQFDDAFESGEHGPTRATEVHFIGNGDGVPGGTTEREAWILAVLAKRASRLFEFGTCTGRTTYLWARNSPPDAHIATITLTPDEADEYRHEGGDSRRALQTARLESRYTRFMYSGAPAEEKVEQLFGDSKELDERPFAADCDLVFVDGSHAYSYVKSDSEKALEMVAPGGVVLWHDYKGPNSDAEGVFRYLNELARELDLVQLQGTNLVAYRAPVDG